MIRGQINIEALRRTIAVDEQDCSVASDYELGTISMWGGDAAAVAGSIILQGFIEDGSSGDGLSVDSPIIFKARPC